MRSQLATSGFTPQLLTLICVTNAHAEGCAHLCRDAIFSRWLAHFAPGQFPLLVHLCEGWLVRFMGMEGSEKLLTGGGVIMGVGPVEETDQGLCKMKWYVWLVFVPVL